MNDSIRYGCHLEIDTDTEPDGCVIDDGNLDDCQYAKHDMLKEDCKFWQPIKDEAKGNLVIAGDKVYAGFDKGDQSEFTNAMVIEFKSAEDLRKAFNEGRVEFTLFFD